MPEVASILSPVNSTPLRGSERTLSDDRVKERAEVEGTRAPGSVPVAVPLSLRYGTPVETVAALAQGCVLPFPVAVAVAAGACAYYMSPE